MSVGESSGGAAQVGPSPEMVACIRAVVEELLDKRADRQQDDSVVEGASGSVAVEPTRARRRQVSGDRV